MKTMKNLALMGAIALTGAVGFTACSSSNDVAEDINPNYNPETNAVKTEFVINVTQPGERTRMTDANAGAGAFQGINNMNLFCMTDAPASADNEIAATDKMTLTSYSTTPAIDGTDNTKTNNSNQVYTMYIPVGTTNFLFYATASLPSTDDKNTRGSLINNLASATTVATATPATTDIKFNLEPIASSESQFTAPQTKLLAVLNGIAGTSYNNNTTDITWASKYNTTETDWRALGDAFGQFTNQAHSNDVRQGSSEAILSMVSDLFPSINEVYTNSSNADVKGLAKAILNKIADYFTVTISGTNPNETYAWPSTGSYKEGTDAATFNTSKYPESLGLPTGAAVIIYNTTIASPAFEYVNNGTMGTAAVSTAYNKFTYPSQLTYYCNSGLWQTNIAKNTDNYPNNSKEWITAGNWSGWASTAVTSATRAVAMQDNITYGVAQLISTIQLGSGVGTTSAPLVDNAAAINTSVSENQSFDGSSAEKTINLKVHGLLVGSQPDAARYDYLPQGTALSNVVYDKFNITGAPLSSSVTNYTLVLDNYLPGDKANQRIVNVALEMTADKEFYGASGKIKPGQKFYLIGSLDPNASGLTGVVWDNHTSFKSGDTGQGVDRVFIRDAKTTATFTLGANCLQKAYSTIPDLRSTQMLFGISVDLAWKTGLTFNVPIGE